MRIPHWEYLSWARDRFGTAKALAGYPAALMGCVKVPDSVYIRPGTADQVVWDEIFRDREYELSIPEPGFIVDAGAHIGLASVFFAKRYPLSTIVAIEPDPDNFAMLRRNARRHKSIRPIMAGVWNKKTKLKIENPEADTWSFRVKESDDGFDAITIDSLVRQYGTIDLLKMDIEGAEKVVLDHSRDWIDKVRTLVIELHDRYVPGCTAALEKAIAGIPFRRTVSGENLVLTRTT